jgi:CheY-like chemotaxis protein
MRGRILIADDDVGLIRLLRMSLEPLDVMIRETYDAISALTLIQREPPDIVILDIGMPGGNGLSACEMLASDRWLSRLPVIILTGRSEASVQDRCRQMGSHYVRKGPEAIAEVKRLVRQLLPPLDSAEFGVGTAARAA